MLISDTHAAFVCHKNIYSFLIVCAVKNDGSVYGLMDAIPCHCYNKAKIKFFENKIGVGCFYFDGRNFYGNGNENGKI